MKVCASINYGPYQNGHKRFDSVKEAISFFREEIVDNYYFTPEFSEYEYSDYGVMDLYPQCDRCTDGATFHDYPMSRYGVGRRGGLVKVVI
jgi:hypothetical protein